MKHVHPLQNQRPSGPRLSSSGYLPLRSAAVLLCFLCISVFLPSGIARAQDIYATVAPNVGGSDNRVDIRNSTGGRLYFYADPAPAAARMSRMDSALIGEYPWPTTSAFAPDPSQSLNRIFPGEYLRVYPKALPENTVITIPFAYGPSGTVYNFRVMVVNGAQVTGMPILDPSPTTAAQVRWRVTFDVPISGVTAANFSFINPANISGLSFASIIPDAGAQPSQSWTVTVNTGTGNGTLGLRWEGHVSESPTVPNSFTGLMYDFQFAPVIDQYPVNVTLNRGMANTMTVVASLRGGGTPNYQWYRGSAANPSAATPIGGANAAFYSTPVFTSTGVFDFFCRVSAGPGTYTDAPCTITVVDPPQITSSPSGTTILAGQTATLSVAATGATGYQWYRGTAPDTSTPVGPASPTSYTTPALFGDTSYWVRVSNAGPAPADSATAVVSVNEVPSLVVTTASDSAYNKDYVTSLREALTYAQSLGGARTITFAPNLAGQTVFLQTGWNGAADDTALRISGDLTIDGGDPSSPVKLVIPQGPQRRHLIAGNGLLQLKNLSFQGGNPPQPNSIGGAAYLYGNAQLTNVRFVSNSAGDGAGLFITNTANVRVTNGLFQYNTATNGTGGGITNAGGTLTVNDSTFTGNGSGNGGAINSDGSLTVRRTIFTNNTSSFNGGALRLLGTATIAESTLSNNSATNGGGGLISHGNTTLTNVTVANNTSLDGGGAQFFEGSASLRFVTIARNTATRSGGGTAVNSANVTATSSIVAGNQGPDQPNVWGAQFNAASTGNVLNLSATAAGLGTLASNGGPTQTIALLRGSPAIDRGAAIPGIGADQRGIARGGSTGGLRGRYYSVPGGPSQSLLAPLSNLEALTANAFAFTPRVDFGVGTENMPGDGSLLDRDGTGGNPFGGVGVNLGTDNIAALWDGIITVPAMATYRFTTRSDDGSVLYIDGRLVVDNNFLQGPTNRSGTVSLTAGQHAILIGFYEGGIGATMQASWEQLNGSSPFARQIIPPSVLSYTGGPVGIAPDIGAYEFTLPEDSNADNKADYVLFSPSTRQSVIWYLNGPTFVTGAFGPTVPVGYSLGCVGDFDRDGNSDYLLYNPSSRQTAVWYLNGASLVTAVFGPSLPSGGYVPVAAADFNGDGKLDYVMVNTALRKTVIWYLDGVAFVDGVFGPNLPSGGWNLVAVGDMNSDAKPDYVLFNPSTRQTVIWYMNNAAITSGVYGPTLPSGWSLEGVADFNNDGKLDLVLYEASTRRTAIWYLNGVNVTSGVYGPTLPGGGYSLISP